MAPKIVTIPNACKETGLKECCIRRWCKEGTFKGYVKSGRKYLINMDLLIAFLNGGTDE